MASKDVESGFEFIPEGGRMLDESLLGVATGAGGLISSFVLSCGVSDPKLESEPESESVPAAPPHASASIQVEDVSQNQSSPT